MVHPSPNILLGLLYFNIISIIVILNFHTSKPLSPRVGFLRFPFATRPKPYIVPCSRHCSALHCTLSGSHCTILHCSALSCNTLPSTVLHWPLLNCTELYCTALYWALLHCTKLYCTALQSQKPANQYTTEHEPLQAQVHPVHLKRLWSWHKWLNFQ